MALTLRTLGGLTHRPRSPARSSSPSRRWPSGSCAPSARSRPPGSRSACPPDHLLPDRLAAVLAVVYLIFNEGYGGRGELAAEALRLGRALAELMPDEPEVHGLLALMLLHDARREARFRDGELVLLADQDRALWDRGADRRGARARSTARSRCAAAARTSSRRRSPSLHAEEPRDWAADRRALRRARAAHRLAGGRAQPGDRGRRGGRARRPASRSSTGSSSTTTSYLHSTRGELLRRLGRDGEARAAYRRALALAHDDAERRLLERRLAECA